MNNHLNNNTSSDKKSTEQLEACRNCEFWHRLEGDPSRGTCSHPERDDKKCVYYYGDIKADSFCAKFSAKK